MNLFRSSFIFLYKNRCGKKNPINHRSFHEVLISTVQRGDLPVELKINAEVEFFLDKEEEDAAGDFDQRREKARFASSVFPDFCWMKAEIDLMLETIHLRDCPDQLCT